jgi:hypothetical protein
MKNFLTKNHLLFLVLSATLYLSLLAGVLSSAQAAEPWQSLFDGKTLQGWEQRGGKAEYRVVDGQIVGRTIPDTPNSFLCTEKSYRDFILELEFQVDANLNSGIQVRGNSFPEYQQGRVHGYQVEIDPSERAWSGGIYDEARRGWLYPLESNSQAQKAFKAGAWNQVRIEALGDQIKTWLNDVPAANLKDDQTSSGFIALQVHSVGKNQERVGLQVRWRNIRILTRDPQKYVRSMALPAKDMINKLTGNEQKDGWKLLFDGRTTSGWRGARLEGFPPNSWEVKDGTITVLESGGAESRQGGDIVTTENFSQFDLCVDFKLTPGANSGIKYFVDPDLNKGPGSAIGLEYQILDDERHPDAKKGRIPGIRTLASLYDLIQAENKPPNPIGEWNHARIISRGRRVEHWLNGRKVLEYERGSEAFRKLVAESKYKVYPGFGERDSGPILLQEHSNRVSFRNLRIRPLK